MGQVQPIFYILAVIAVVAVFFFWFMERKAVTENSDRTAVIGFWKRFVSDVLDAFLLGLFGFMLFFLAPVFNILGEKGWWIGLVVTFLYAGISQSAIGNGQSLAKRLLGIQVIKRDGTFMSISESFLRYSVLAFIAYGGWILAGLTASFPFLKQDWFLTFFGLIQMVCFLGVVLIVPVHPLKQGLHDLLVNTVVVRVGSFTPERIEALRDVRKERRAYVIIFVMVALLVMAAGTIKIFFTDTDTLSKLFETSRRIEEVTSFQNIGFEFKVNSGELVLKGFLPVSKFNDKDVLQAEVKKAVDLVMTDRPVQKDFVLTFQVRTGYNIGITSRYNTQVFRFSSKDLGQRKTIKFRARTSFAVTPVSFNH